MIILNGKEWARIHQEIAREFPPSYLLIREVMKRELGFTTRQHTHWDNDNNQHVSIMYLDFYDDAKETFFRMKYL